MKFILDRGVDKSIFKEAYECDLKLICVGNDNLRSKIVSRVNDKLENVTITSTPNGKVNARVPGLTNTSFVNSGISTYNKDIIQKVDINIFDSRFYTRFYTKDLLHTDAHELFHMFSALVPGIMKNNRNVYYENGKIYYNCIGDYSIFYNGEFTQLGLMFSETITDLLTTISLNTYSPHFLNRESANKVFKTNHFVGNGNITGYTFFTSMTRLALAAFNNDPNVDYDMMISKGQNLFFSRIKGRNGEVMMKNDLLYGYMADPLHTKREFEKIAGPGSYDKFMYALDEVFNNTLTTGRIDNKKIKQYMKVLPSFLNLKLKRYKELGIYNDEDIIKLTSNFNNIWNEMKKEYKVYFSQSEINEFYNYDQSFNFKKTLSL